MITLHIPTGFPQARKKKIHKLFQDVQGPSSSVFKDLTSLLGLQSNFKQAVRVATQYTSAHCKFTISLHLFARWHLFRHVGYLRH